MTLSLNSWRFWLAFMVVISHLLDGFLPGPAGYAVWGFFILSGFLMTLTINTKYGFSLSGIKHYAKNRFLRIYPLYIFAVIIGFVVLVSAKNLSIDPHSLNPSFGLPVGISQYLQNIIPLPFFDQSNLAVPVAWALYIEFLAYLILPIMAKEKLAAWMAFIVGLMANYQMGFDLSSFNARYSGLGTTMMAFAAGSLLFHYRKELAIMVMPKTSVIVWILHCAIWYYNDLYPWGYGIYISLLLSSWVTTSLITVKPSNFGKLLGDISYPLYLLHTTCGLIISFYIGTQRTLTLFIASFALSMLISYLSILIIDKNIDKFKYKAPR